MNKGLGRYAIATVGVVLGVGALLSLAFRGPGDLGAIWLSAAIALGVQLAAFPISRLAGVNNLMARMGAGAMMRLFTVIVYAFVAANLLTVPLVAALISLAAFLFLSTLIEPLLIKT